MTEDKFGVKKALAELGIGDQNQGASTGAEWIHTNGIEIASVSPVDGQLIAKVNAATEQEYQKVIDKAVEAFRYWRSVPAPRSPLIRLLAMLPPPMKAIVSVVDSVLNCTPCSKLILLWFPRWAQSLRGSRAPKMAVPTRTCVAPAAMAAR